MAVEVLPNSPLAEALQSVVGPKLTELGWSTGAADDLALQEYLILMLVNGKTQEEMASELANDMLTLGSDDPNPKLFSEWLFQQVQELDAQLNGGSANAAAQDMSSSSQVEMQGSEGGSASGAMDATMSDGTEGAADGSIPTGPKSMRNGANGNGQRTRDRRMLGQMSRAMDRGNDASLHRIKGAASRINQHAREPPKAPRGMANRAPNMVGGRGAGMGGMNAGMMANNNPQQQMQLLQLLEEQSRMMAQILGPGANAPAINPAFFGGGAPPNANAGKSLFERVEGAGRGGSGGGVRGNGAFKTQRKPQNNGSGDAMDTDGAGEGENGEKKDQSEVPCRFQLSCTSATCPFAHQSPAAPAGTSIDMTDKCSFGAACTNRKCTGVHPSPAQKRQHLSTTVDCKFYPNCTNPSCPFRHPTTPPCRNGADCPTKDSGCTYSHSTIACRYNPCLNPGCVFKHSDGQKRGKFEDKVWTAEGFDRAAAERQDRGHVSERRFVAGEEEELILPGSTTTGDEKMDDGGAGNGGAGNGGGGLSQDMSSGGGGTSEASLQHEDIVT